MVPFGLVAGFSAVDAGLSRVQGIAQSSMIFAGASQLATIELLRRDAALPVVVATILVINARFLMYSGVMAPYFVTSTSPTRMVLSYFVTDQTFALALVRFEQERHDPADRVAFFLGSGITLWSVWQVSTAIGVLTGTALPAGLTLEFAIPLVFLALLVPTLRDIPAGIAAVTSGGIAIAAAPVPYNAGLWLAAIGGIGAGLVAARRQS